VNNDTLVIMILSLWNATVKRYCKWRRNNRSRLFPY